ncbi:MAG: hypothetical protein WDM91_18160 [Rhizomicrobium sp.]
MYKDNVAAKRLPWQTPRLRAIAASAAQMPVGKTNPGSDGISMS